MTCIVGIVKNKKVYMGGDAAASTSSSISVRAVPKVFYNKQYLIGYTSSFRMGQILQYDFQPPTPNKKDLSSKNTIMKFMVTQFVPELRKVLTDGGFTSINSNEERGGNFLIGLDKYLLEIETDFQVAMNTCGYAAIGSGTDVALGAMYTMNKDPHKSILNALSAAEMFVPSVRHPFTILST